MEIVKLHCLGSGYIVAGPDIQQYSLPALAGALCRQRHGAGGDGMIVLSPGPPGRWRFELFNAQGARVASETNALRCAAYYLGEGSWELDTGSGLQRVDVNGNTTVLWFPPPSFGGVYQIGRDFHGLLVDMMQRYFVTFVHQLGALNLELHGLALERYFGGINVVFVQDGKEIEIRLWQKDRGEIPGSGAGACAAAAGLRRVNKWREPMPIRMSGGQAVMTIDEQGRFVQQAVVQQVLRAQVADDLLAGCVN